MLKYIIKRVVLALITIWAVATITFFLMNMVPGGPFMAEKAISAQAQKALFEKYGLDKPGSLTHVSLIKAFNSRNGLFFLSNFIFPLPRYATLCYNRSKNWRDYL